MEAPWESRWGAQMPAEKTVQAHRKNCPGSKIGGHKCPPAFAQICPPNKDFPTWRLNPVRSGGHLCPLDFGDRTFFRRAFMPKNPLPRNRKSTPKRSPKTPPKTHPGFPPKSSPCGSPAHNLRPCLPARPLPHTINLPTKFACF